MKKQSIIIKDLQTGDVLEHTSPLELFEECKADFMANAWTDEEEKEYEKMFSAMTYAEKLHWLEINYDYKVILEKKRKKVKYE